MERAGILPMSVAPADTALSAGPADRIRGTQHGTATRVRHTSQIAMVTADTAVTLATVTGTLRPRTIRFPDA